MKAKYIQPSVFIQTIELTNIICTSPGAPGFGTGSASTDSEQDGGGYMLSRHGNVWDDED